MWLDTSLLLWLDTSLLLYQISQTQLLYFFCYDHRFAQSPFSSASGHLIKSVRVSKTSYYE